MKYNIGIILVLLLVLGLPVKQELMAAVQSSELAVEASNGSEAIKPAIEDLKADDAYGFGISVIAMGAVFLGLICLYLVFKVSDKVALSLRKKRVKKSGFTKEEARNLASESGEVFAAIAMALEEISDEDHDDENMVLTMKNVARSYSPWSSKIYTLRDVPHRK